MRRISSLLLLAAVTAVTGCTSIPLKLEPDELAGMTATNSLSILQEQFRTRPLGGWRGRRPRMTAEGWEHVVAIGPTTVQGKRYITPSALKWARFSDIQRIELEMWHWPGLITCGIGSPFSPVVAKARMRDGSTIVLDTQGLGAHILDYIPFWIFAPKRPYNVSRERVKHWEYLRMHAKDTRKSAPITTKKTSRTRPTTPSVPSPESGSFSLKSIRTGRIYGPFSMQNGAAVKVGTTEFALTRAPGSTKASLVAKKTAKTFGPLEFRNDAKLTIGSTSFTVTSVKMPQKKE